MGSWKLEKDALQGGLPEFLRALADALEGKPGAGGPDELADLPAGEPRELELLAEIRGAGLAVRLKVKPADKAPAAQKRPDAPKAPKPAKTAKEADASARAREKYRQLKKTMQAEYKALRKAAQGGVMPPQDVLESFLGLAEVMCEAEQPASGAAAVELAQASCAFLEDARALRRAVSARDASGLAEVLLRLERRKSACHAQFR